MAHRSIVDVLSTQGKKIPDRYERYWGFRHTASTGLRLERQDRHPGCYGSQLLVLLTENRAGVTPVLIMD